MLLAAAFEDFVHARILAQLFPVDRTIAVLADCRDPVE